MRCCSELNKLTGHCLFAEVCWLFLLHLLVCHCLLVDVLFAGRNLNNVLFLYPGAVEVALMELGSGGAEAAKEAPLAFCCEFVCLYVSVLSFISTVVLLGWVVVWYLERALGC